MPKHICFILDFYPTQGHLGCIFAKNLIYAFANKGVKCTVISPQAITPGNLKRHCPFYRTEKVENGETIEIFMPYFAYFKAKKSTIKISMNNHYRATMNIIKKYNIKPDMVYGHFLFQCGLTASRVGEKLGIPSYYACGENSTRLAEGSEPYATGMKYGDFRKITDNLSGIISVSNYNKKLLISNNFVSSNMNIGVFPNAVDPLKFFYMDKSEARKMLGFPQDKFVVVFNGEFTERKGFNVLCDALNLCDGVYSVFIGSNDIIPSCSNLLFSGRVEPENVRQYLSAADVFVLPTLGEGCCNAIVESLACGLPVISSDLPFNDDILDDDCSIRVNPTDAKQIAEAIKKLKNNENQRSAMSNSALKKAEMLQIGRRAEMIMEFMKVNNND